MKRPAKLLAAISLMLMLAGVGDAGRVCAHELLTHTVYWDSGAVRIEYTYYLEGNVHVRHGSYTEWYENGDEERRGHYRHGLKNGKWYFMRQDGDAHDVEVFVDDVRLHARQYNAMGNLILHHDFDITRPHPGVLMPVYGQSISYHTQGGELTGQRLRVTTSVSEKTPDGKSYYWSEQWSEEFYYSGALREHYRTVNYLEPGPYTGRTGYQREGTMRTYHENGQVWQEKDYVEGLAHGPYLVWFPDGRIANVGQNSNNQNCGYYYTYRYDPDSVSVSYRGVCQPFASPPPPDDPETPDDPKKTIQGRVRHALTDNPLSGVVVSGDGINESTGAGGYYQVNVGNRDSVTISFRKEGFRSGSANVSLVDHQSRTVNVKLPPIADDTEILDVVSRYGNIFLEGIPLINEYTASVDWGDSDPGHVYFNLNGDEQVVAGTESGGVISYNMGADFNAVLDRRGNTLAVTSLNIEGRRSEGVVEIHPLVLPLPPWSLSLGIFGIEKSGDVYTYKMAASYPSDEPLAIEISPDTLGALWSAWSLIPVIGGQRFGIPPTQLSMDIELSTEGTGSIGASGMMGFKAAGGEIEAKLSGKGLLAYDQVDDDGIMFKGAELGGGLSGTVKREFGPVTVIPALAGAISLPLLGRPIAWFNNRAKIDAAVKVGGELKFILVNTEEGIVFDSTEGVLSSSVELGLGGELGRVKARVSGGGGSTLTYQLPANPDYLKEVEAEMVAKLEFVLWSYETEYEVKGTLTYSGGEVQSSGVSGDVVSTGPRLINTAFVETEPYHWYGGGELNDRQVQSEGDGQDTLFVGNVFPYAEPAYAESGSNHALVYVVYDPTQPVSQGNELWATFLADGEWSPPARVTQDTHNDYAPSIAFLDDNRLLAVWERVRPPDFIGGTPEEMAGHIEIAHAVYDASLGSWTAPEFLTDNTVLDFAPILAASTGGMPRAFWLHSPGNELIGDTEQPVYLYYAAWNGSGFDAPSTHPYAFSNAFDFSFATDGERSWVAWIQDGDGDLTTTDDQQLHLSFYDGTAWSDPEPLLPEAMPSSRPRLLSTGVNQWELFWQRGDSIVRLTDWDDPAMETIRTGSDGFGFTDFHLSLAADGRILLLWRGIEDETPDLYYRVFDSVHGVWSEDLRLTRNTGRETALAGGLGDDGMIRLFFTRERSAEPVTDLYYREHPLGHNLSAETSLFEFTPDMPRLNQPASLTAFVRNSGDLACGPVSAAFYLGNPDAGGEWIATVEVEPAVLPAGALGSATLADWIIPADIGLESVYVVFDPDGDIIDPVKGDNVAVLDPVWIDVAVSRVAVSESHANGDVDLVASVANLGNAIARDVPVVFKVEDRLLDTVTLPALLPGMTAQIGISVGAGVFVQARSKISVEADAGRLLPDLDWGNNVFETVINRVFGRSTADDGMHDDWKLRHFGRLDVDPNDDPDGDGMTNLEEFLVGTDPLDASSFFRMQPNRIDAMGITQVSWPGRAGQWYRVEKSVDLENWTILYNNLTALRDGKMFAIDASGGVTNRAFYRIRMFD